MFLEMRHMSYGAGGGDARYGESIVVCSAKWRFALLFAVLNGVLLHTSRFATNKSSANPEEVRVEQTLLHTDHALLRACKETTSL